MGWIILAFIVVGAALIWRAARKRSGGASVRNGPSSRDSSVNYGNMMNQASGTDQRTNFTGGL